MRSKKRSYVIAFRDVLFFQGQSAILLTQTASEVLIL
jgi:hypothetical protein